jgi:mannose-6-phosphate isomerase-like protein (cupin superfamily)
VKFLPPLTLVFLATTALGIRAQSAQIDVYSTEQLAAMTRNAGTRPGATPALSSEILKHYPNHYSMFVVRHEDGQSEWHASYADFFFIVEGSAKLCTGGTMLGEKETAPGERRGASLKEDNCVLLKAGDIAHVPATIPHQVRVPSGQTFSYFVVKASEAPDK